MLLGATIRLKDQFSPVLKEIKQETRGFESKLKIMNKMVIRPVVRIKDDATRQIGRIKSSLMSLQGLATVTLGAIGLHELGKATVGAAAQTELQLMNLETVLKSQAKAREYLAWTMKEATKTMFSDTEMMTAAVSLAPYARQNISLFQKMMQTAEVLASINPAEGLEGGAFALREALSGDFVSLQERFNLPRSVINNLKAGASTAEDFLGVVQKAAASLGYSYAIVEKQGLSSIGLWNKVTGVITSSFRSVGFGILDSVRPRLMKISDWFDKNEREVERWRDDLVRLGRDAFEGILSRAETFLGRLRDRFRDPEFARLDWGGKLSALLDGAITGAQNWIAGPGGQKLTAMGVSMGLALGKGLIQSFGTVLAEHPVLRTALMSYAGWKVGGIWGAGIGVTGSVAAEIPRQAVKLGEAVEARRMRDFWSFKQGYEQLEKTPAGQPMIPGGELRARGHASGLPYVPYDNYLAVLHRGERVLTAAENRQHEKAGAAGQTISINSIIINGVNKTTREIVDELVDELRRAMINMPAAVPR